MLRIGSVVALLLATAGVSAPVGAQWTTDALSEPRGTLVAVAIGDYVLFAGGDNPSPPGNSSKVDIYNVVTGAWTTHALSQERAFLSGTAVGPYALFAGGGVSSTTALDTVDIYDSTLGLPDDPLAWSTAQLSQPRFSLAAASVGGKAIFAGGGPGALDTVDVYDSALGPPSNPGAWTTDLDGDGQPDTLSRGRTGLTAASVGSQVLFAGGADPALGPLDTVDIYDDSTLTWSTAALSEARLVGSYSSATVGTRAYFGGGELLGFMMSDVVDIYDAQTGTWSCTTLPEPLARMSAAALGNTVIFAGGFDSSPSLSTAVHMLNTGTGKWTTTSALSEGRWGMARATAGGKVLFGGGRKINADPASDRVDIYEPVGVNYCAATPNSSGGAATISASGSLVAADQDLTLAASCCPDDVPGLFYFGPVQLAGAVFGDGLRCVGVPQSKRMYPFSTSGPANGNAPGTAMLTANFSAPYGSSMIAGASLNFQYWYRDGAAMMTGFNLSDALNVVFQ